MKLPKGFGGQGLGSMMKQAQEAMAQAQNLEAALASETFTVDKGPVKAVFNGIGEMLSIKIDPSVIDPEDVEALEDLILGTVRDGVARSTEMRSERVQSIMPKIPGL
jgi:DNA-binding YbaB/EbfC family protein